MEFDRQKVIDEIFGNFAYKFNTKEVRTRIIEHLNRTFFPDGIAKFIDYTSLEDTDKGNVSLMINYNGTLYNLLAFEKFALKIERLRKLKKINSDVGRRR